MLAYFAISLLFWASLFVVSNSLESLLLRKKLAYVNSAYNSVSNLSLNVIHGLTLIVWGILGFLEMNYGKANSLSQNLMLCFSSGFFIVDTIALIFTRHKKFDVYLHHTFCLTAYIYTLYSNSFGWELSAACAIGEMGPCVYFELIAKKTNMLSPKFRLINDTLYLFSFFISRLIYLTVILAFVLTFSDFHSIIKVLAIAFWGLGIYWSHLLYKRYHRRYENFEFNDYAEVAFLDEQLTKQNSI